MSPVFDLVAFAKRTLRALLAEQTIGIIDYIRFPNRVPVWAGGAFNGQPARQALFREIIAKMRPHTIVETGTHLGMTTDFMAQTGLPIFSIEEDPRSHGFVRARFWRRHNINLLHGDSRTALRELFDGPLCDLYTETLFFYLDAHWNDDLPLAEEIDIIFSQCPSAVVMIDDFQVPFDEGYGYDDYGPGKVLVPRYIAPAVSAHRLETFYPSTPSVEEGGARRGCIVLAKQAFHIPVLASMPLLRPAAEVEPGSMR